MNPDEKMSDQDVEDKIFDFRRILPVFLVENYEKILSHLMTHRGRRTMYLKSISIDHTLRRQHS